MSACLRIGIRGAQISAYSSTDLYNWKFEGIVFRTSDVTIAPPAGTVLFIERPKVVHSPEGDFVLYFKLMATPGSVIRQLGIARSNTPTGSYVFEHGVYPAGQDTGDLTVYDNSAHRLATDPEFAVVFTGDLRDPNASVIISPLVTPAIDNTTAAGECGRVPQKREGEAIFWDARNRQYTLVSSHTTGWKPNPSEWFVSKSLCGNLNWTSIGNRAMGSNDTFGAQSTFALELSSGNVVLMMDKWNWQADELLNMSTYVWLPVQYHETDGLPMVSWYDKWDLGIFSS